MIMQCDYQSCEPLWPSGKPSCPLAERPQLNSASALFSLQMSSSVGHSLCGFAFIINETLNWLSLPLILMYMSRSGGK